MVPFACDACVEACREDNRISNFLMIVFWIVRRQGFNTILEYFRVSHIRILFGFHCCDNNCMLLCQTFRIILLVWFDAPGQKVTGGQFDWIVVDPNRPCNHKK